MDPIELLTRQHEEAELLFQQVAVASGEERTHLFRRLAYLLTLHTHLEERFFYPEVKLAETSELIRHSYDDHAEATALITQMLHLDVSDMQFEPALISLRESVEAHVAEERSVLFPQVRRLLSAEHFARLGNELARGVSELTQPGALPAVSHDSQLGTF
ncbi:hemerythrin domain-containing protein [Archangium lansingense]|uniref:Hemerythrin domain-containing protein n=1 Tax=Archangium lansingense TaxID=2995310 RepID=A0ABT4AGS5_9BACT|nr:hemerythrin domain-containing protein [Archangium lansinium]MCY1080880.1 hemerythrin domain-containing protein [Archangium lansinium]